MDKRFSLFFVFFLLLLLGACSSTSVDSVVLHEQIIAKNEKSDDAKFDDAKSESKKNKPKGIKKSPIDINNKTESLTATNSLEKNPETKNDGDSNITPENNEDLNITPEEMTEQEIFTSSKKGGILKDVDAEVKNEKLKIEKKQKDMQLKYTYEFIIEGLNLNVLNKSSEQNESNNLKESSEQNESNELKDSRTDKKHKNKIALALEAVERLELLKKGIIDLLRENSQLEFLKEDPIESVVALERRASNDVINAVSVMESYGFYSSFSKFRIEEDAQAYKVFLYLTPNEQYTVNQIKVNYLQKSQVPKSFSERERNVGFLYRKQVKSYTFEFPNELPGVNKGDKAVATNITDAVSKIVQPFRENGFPNAKVISSTYAVNKKTYELSGNVSINQGFPAFMGHITVSGNKEVSSEFIKALSPWKYGDVWNEQKLLEYRDIIQKTGLFQNVDLQFDKKAYREYNKKMRKNRKSKNLKTLEPIALPVLITVRETISRSVSGALFYSTDRGPGINLAWEHRNFFGNGEKLRLELPLSKEKSVFSSELRKPAFVFPTQTLILKGSGGYEETDAYEQNFIDIAAGLERKIRENWRIESLIHLDRVIPKENDAELAYSSLRWINTVDYDKRDNKQNPSSGFENLVRFSPLLGYDESSFYSFGIEFDGSVYYPLMENIVLVARLGFGAMPGANEGKIPRGKRFFLGGGGTVRGFSYQELGKHNADDNPLGGLSYNLMNLEAKIKIDNELSVIPFVDSGMVYDEVSPQWGQDLAWGAGLGVQYITPVGPIRLDIAVPFTNPNETVKKSFTDFQIYISIGQAF